MNVLQFFNAALLNLGVINPFGNPKRGYLETKSKYFSGFDNLKDN